MRGLKQAREALRLSVRRFAEEAGVSTRTVQNHESGGTPRRDVAERYAAALRRYGVDPSQIREVAEALGEVFVVDAEPYWKLRNHKLRGLREDLIGLIRTGSEEAVRDLVDEVAAEYGQEGREARERAEAEYRREVDQEQEGEA
jgi:transcriptional regulator with XRE-family HTH domain